MLSVHSNISATATSFDKMSLQTYKIVIFSSKCLKMFVWRETCWLAIVETEKKIRLFRSLIIALYTLGAHVNSRVADEDDGGIYRFSSQTCTHSKLHK